MQTNKDLALEIAKHLELHQVLSDRDTLEYREKLQKTYKEFIANKVESEGVIREQKNDNKILLNKNELKHTYWKLAIAAVFVIGLGILLWDNSGTSNTTLFGNYYKPFPIDDSTRDATKKAMSEVFKDYANGNYEQTIYALESRLKEKNEDKLRIFLGNSYLNTNQDKKAKEEFKKIVGSSMFYEAVQWYLALTYLLGKGADSTKCFLEKVIDYKGLKRKRQKSFLDKLK